MALVTRFDTPASLRDLPAGSAFYDDWHAFLAGSLNTTPATGTGTGEFYRPGPHADPGRRQRRARRRRMGEQPLHLRRQHTAVDAAPDPGVCGRSLPAGHCGPPRDRLPTLRTRPEDKPAGHRDRSRQAAGQHAADDPAARHPVRRPRGRQHAALIGPAQTGARADVHLLREHDRGPVRAAHPPLGEFGDPAEPRRARPDHRTERPRRLAGALHRRTGAGRRPADQVQAGVGHPDRRRLLLHAADQAITAVLAA